MLPVEFTFFSATLFLALVALLHWKRRRMLARQRVNRGLKGYVSSAPPTQGEAEREETAHAA
jgi:hypothetical protein